MNAMKKSASSENMPQEEKTEDDLKSVSANNITSSKEPDSENEKKDEVPNVFTLDKNSLNKDIVTCDPNDPDSPCEKVKSAFADRLAKDNNDDRELFPCDSCEFKDTEEAVVFFCCGRCKRTKPLHKVSEYWIISVPKEEKTFETLNAATKSLSQNYKFHTPMLKVGILNTLLEHIEHLKTLDTFINEVLENLVKVLKNELGTHPDLLEENCKVNDLRPATYLTRFKWDQSKYPTCYRISIISDQIYSYLDNINECMKQKLNLLDKINSIIKPYEQRGTESLRIRYLGDIVKKEHFVQDSNFLTTLLVIVPNDKSKFWKNTYVNFSEMVVPGSSTRIFKDDSESLYSVTLSRKGVEEFKETARMHSFIVREYEYSEENLANEKKYYENLAVTKKRLKSEILRWTKLMFSEAFEAWIHIKTLRVFVESVVRFGLPVNYQAMLLRPLKSKTKLKKILHKLYNDIDPVLKLDKSEKETLPGGLATQFDVSEYHPYVYFDIDLGFIYT